MPDITFEWSSEKAAINLAKHGVSFDEARSVFYDEHAIEFYDDDHADWEDRFLLIGLSMELRILLVCHCYRAQDDVIRIISARRATRTESRYYQRT